MSTYELPPILNEEPISGLINVKNCPSRSNTFHNYNFKNKCDQKIKRHSVHGDSSVQRYANIFASEALSAASLKSRARVLSAGTESRHYREATFTLADLTNGVNKDTEGRIRYLKMKDGVRSTAATRNVAITEDKKTHFLPSSKSTMKRSDSENKIVTGKKHVDKKLPISISVGSLTSYCYANGVERSTVQYKNVRTINGTKQLKLPANNYNTFGHGDNNDHHEQATFFNSDLESDQDQRVKEWINGVVDAEPPEEPEIVQEDEPPQRDTAIRIIYDGDS